MPIRKKCPYCNREFYVSDSETLSFLYCPFFKAKVYSPDMDAIEKKKEEDEKKAELEKIRKAILFQQEMDKYKRKSSISQWWLPIVLLSAFFTLSNGGPITNLIGWPIIIIYIIENSKSTGRFFETDSTMILCGAIIWIINLLMVISIGF